MPHKTKPLPELTPNDIERFWKFVAKSEDPDACWTWKGYRMKRYGGFRVKRPRRNIVATRIMWLIHTGKDPFPLHVLHSCDNRICVNPQHLFLGTDTDNIKDSIAKGRWNLTRPKGEDMKNVKLTADQVREIRERYARGEVSIPMLSREYKICRTEIHGIIHRRRWKHI